MDQYVRLFEKFISENGGRAQKNRVPLTYMEIVGLWNTFIAPSPINMGAVDKVINTKMEQYMKGSDGVLPRQVHDHQGDRPILVRCAAGSAL